MQEYLSLILIASATAQKVFTNLIRDGPRQFRLATASLNNPTLQEDLAAAYTQFTSELLTLDAAWRAEDAAKPASQIDAGRCYPTEFETGAGY